ncbi:MAG: hypothetical protein HOQ24_11485 [Mycobacteriaceae bacterium]|nr:hypothetical protein [Mycobacteriaceae bacterium]
MSSSADVRWLPDKAAVLAACRGSLPYSNPVLTAAKALADIYEAGDNLSHGIVELLSNDRSSDPDDVVKWAEFLSWVVGRSRSDLIRRVDEWVELVVPAAPPSSPMHPRTVGQTIDSLAHMTIRSFSAFANEPASAARALHCRLALLADEYETLRRDVSAGVRRVPAEAVNTPRTRDGEQ